jgi:predicted nucleic acid-binding protein
MIYVDANFWIYWFDQRLPEHKYVLEPMRSAINKGILLNVTTLMEVAHYLRHLPKEEFQGNLENILSLETLTLTSLDVDLTKLAFEQLAKYAKMGVGGRDSVILATMKITGTKGIASHDEVFKRIKGLEVIDPIPKT